MELKCDKIVLQESGLILQVVLLLVNALIVLRASIVEPYKLLLNLHAHYARQASGRVLLVLQQIYCVINVV